MVVIKTNSHDKLILTLLLMSFIGSSGCYNSDKASLNEQNVICKSCPVIKDGQDTIDFINEVRFFVAQNSNRGILYNSLCDTFYRIPVNTFSVDTFINIFNNNEGITSCGLSALLMVKILLHNGIKSYTYNFGFSNTQYTHVIVLANVSNKLKIFDPYLNYQMLNESDSNVVDIFELFNIIVSGKESLIYNPDACNPKYILDFNKFDTMQAYIYGQDCIDWLHKFKKLPDLKNNQDIRICSDYVLENPCVDFVQEFENHLQLNTTYSKFYEAFLLKINKVQGADDYEEIDIKIDSAINLRSKNFMKNTVLKQINSVNYK